MSERDARRIVYGRSSGCCEVCGNHPGQSWHHRQNRSQGGRWTPANGLHVCGDGTTGCHGWIGANPAESYEYGWLVRGHADPLSESVLYRGRRVLLTDDGSVLYVEGHDDDHRW